MALRRINFSATAMYVLASLTFALLYLPALIMGVMSFNDASLPAFPLEGFSTRWYTDLGSSSEVRESLVNSTVIAFTTMVISVSIGTLAAFGLVRSRFRGRNVVFTVILLPMLMPALILAVALLLFFNFAGIELGVVPVIIGHVVITLPFVVLIVSLRLFGFDRTLEEAARDLGARPLKVLRHVTLPIMAPGLMAAALFSFLISWDEVLIAFYNIDNRSTLPIYIWTQLRHRITMDLVALGTILSALTALLVVVAWFAMKDREPKPASES
jgi:spermidine/putrescine transport system permease protein